MNKKEYIDYAGNLGWTKADAERAFKVVVDPNSLTNEVTVLKTLVVFAGEELASRQRLQASQKAQATRNRNEKVKLEEQFVDATKQFETKLEEERGRWQSVLAKVYRKLQAMGIHLPWIEDLLKRG